jgi:hypothetical protein
MMNHSIAVMAIWALLLVEWYAMRLQKASRDCGDAFAFYTTPIQTNMRLLYFRLDILPLFILVPGEEARMHPAITGADLRAMRRAIGLSQHHLAALMHVSASRIKAWEAERPFMPDDMVILFLEVFMARLAQHDHLIELVLVARLHVLSPPTVFGLPDGLSPSSSAG